MNIKIKQTVALATVMAVAVSLSPMYVGAAEANPPAQTKEHVMPTIGKVNISNGSFELLNVQELEQTTDKIVSFVLRLHNNGSQGSLDFRNYWVRVKSKSGTTFTVSQLNGSREKDVVPAGAYQDYQFYAKVSKNTNITDLQFNLIQWDFGQANFERVLGTISVPTTYSKTVPVGQSYNLTWEKTSMKALVKRTATGQNDKNFLPSVTIQLQNTGTQSITGLKLNMYLRTKDGLFYPLDSTMTEATVFNPLEEKDFLLSGVVPVGAGSEGWQLVVTQTVANGEAGNLALPLASFDLPLTTTQEVSIGSEQLFSTEDGTYTAVLSNITRLPWEDQDILAANVTIHNHGTTPIPVPALSGKFEMDEVVEAETEIVQFDKVLTIAPGSKIEVQFISKIPYTYDFKKVSLFVNEKAEENKPAVELLRFHHSSDLMGVPTIASGQVHTIESVGKRTSLKVRSSDVYEHTSTVLVSAFVDATNLEKRYTAAGSLIGQFKTSDGAYYPATVVKPSSTIAPNGIALLQFEGTIPKNVPRENLQLIVGEAVEPAAGGSGGENAPAASSYVNAVAFQLPRPITEPQDHFKEINAYPYTLSMSRIGTQVDFNSNTLNLKFDYTLDRDFMVEADTTSRRIVIEMVDGNTGKKYTHELKLDDGMTEAANATGNMFELGTHTMDLPVRDDDLVRNVSLMKNFVLNVYDQTKTGYKKLVATKEVTWFMIND